MTTRRQFLKSTAMLSAAALVSPSLLRPEKRKIGLQLYTVRGTMATDPKGTIEKVAKVGFNSVEAAGYSADGMFYGMKPQDFSKLLEDNGLIIPSSHYSFGEDKDPKGNEKLGTILHGWDKAVQDGASIGLKYMVCAYLSPTERGGLDHYKIVADSLNKAGEICKKSGIQLCYHNHDFEFEKQNGKMGYDILLDQTDKDLVKMEMDLFWVNKAGYNPIDLFKAHPHRFALWHVKDMDRTPEKKFTEVGNGTIDFISIFDHAGESGMKYFFVEQDQCPGNPFDSINQSYTYIKDNLI